MPATHYEWNPFSDNIIVEYDDNGNTIAEYTYEPGYHGRLISENRGGVTSQYHFDGLGDTIALSDDNGQVTDTIGYTAFGEVTERTGSTPTPFAFLAATGNYTDPITGLVDVNRRPYSPYQGRWLPSDAIQNIRNARLRRHLLDWMKSPYSFVALAAWQAEKPKYIIFQMPDPKILEPLKKTGDCGGATFKIEWDVDEAARKEGGAGAVIQLVTVDWKVTDCCGGEKKHGYPADTWPQWEAWEFDAVPDENDTFDDTFSVKDQGRDSKGSVRIVGKAAAFLNYKLPEDFDRETKEPFGRLPRSKKKPPGWDEAKPYVEHELLVTWDCCADPPKKTQATTIPTK